MNKIHRHHYTPQVFLLESIGREDPNRVFTRAPITKRLSVFAQLATEDEEVLDKKPSAWEAYCASLKDSESASTDGDSE